MSTLEQRVKAAVPKGSHLVRFTLGERSRVALVHIASNGRVRYLVKPDEHDMYASRRVLRGDDAKQISGEVFVWPGKDPAFMRQFEGEVMADIPIR